MQFTAFCMKIALDKYCFSINRRPICVIADWYKAFHSANLTKFEQQQSQTEYAMDIMHIKGSENIVADCMSHLLQQYRLTL